MIFTTLAISLIMCANRVTLAAVALGKAQEHPSKFFFFVGHLEWAHQIVSRFLKVRIYDFFSWNWISCDLPNYVRQPSYIGSSCPRQSSGASK